MGLACSLFARHYSGSRGFFPFLRLVRCFSSPACHCSPYVFRREHARITTRRFPHSEIPGSKVGQHLPRLYPTPHGLHPPLTPKHPPPALIFFIQKNNFWFPPLSFSRCARACPHRKPSRG